MHTPYDSHAQTQPPLPHVRVEHAAGQGELLEPGPRVEADDVPRTRARDPRQCYLPGLEGVRVGADWRRDSAPGEHAPWTQLELRLRGICKRLGRNWSARDRETLLDLQLQTWGIVELGDRKAIIPEWMRAEVIDTPNGELELGRNAPTRIMLAWLWAAFEAGAGGVLMTRAQWAEALCCSERSVHNHWQRLEARGLIRRVQTWRPAELEGEPRRGSMHGPVLCRIGPALDCVALAAFERPWVTCARGRVSRHAARELAGALRGSARARGRELQLAYAERRARYKATSAGRGIVWRPRAEGAKPARTMCARPAKSASLPAPPPLTGRAGELGGSAQGASVGASPLEIDAGRRSSAPAERLPAPPTGTAAPAAAEASAPAELAEGSPRPLVLSWTPPATTDPRPENASRRRATARGAAPRNLTRTFADAIAELARGVGAVDPSVQAGLLAGLASIGVAELEQHRSSEPPAYAAPLERPATAPPDPSPGEVSVDRFEAALRALEREQLRGLDLFDHASSSSSSSTAARAAASDPSSSSEPSSSSSSTRRTRQ